MSLVFPEQQTEVPHLINGAWEKGEGPKKDILSPYTGESIGYYHQGTEQEVIKVIESAARAQKSWASTPIKERSQFMYLFRSELLKHIDELSQVVAIENGKTIAEAKAGVLKGVEVLEFALSLQNLDTGGKMEVSRGVQCEYRRVPAGVVASITPFNFPAMVPMWTLPIAITLGNAYIWKPSEQTPMASKFMGQMLQDVKLPSGVLSIIQGGAEVAQTLIEHPQVKSIGFVGSTKIARDVYRHAAQHDKKVLALGGAKNHIILLPDASVDLCSGISDSFTGCAGQRCMAASVLLAVGDCDQHIESIKARAMSLKLGEDMGAIISKKQLEFLHTSIEQAVKEGASILLDGRDITAPTNYQNGYWLGPTILDHVKPHSAAAQQELFGPILSIVRCKTLSEALEIEASSTYGNACSVFTSHGALAEQVVSQAQAGMIGINIGVPVPREPFSFGGLFESKFGTGDITGIHSLGLWSDMKKVTTKWTKQTDQNWMS